MEYRIDLPGALPDPALLARLLDDEDAAAVMELDSVRCVWRVSTSLRAHELVGLLAAAGVQVAATQVTLLPSVCCGGCSG